jgi:hypothetical protein
MKSLSEIWRNVQHWAAKHEIMGPDPAVTKELESQGWKFRTETVFPMTPSAPAAIDILHPITPEGYEIGRESLHWPRYEAARIAAVDKLFGKPAPSGPACNCS